MRKHFLLLSFLLPFLVNAQTNKKSYAITEQDRKNYVLYIDQVEYIDQKKTNEYLAKMQSRGLPKETFAAMNLILENNSNDTLKFWSPICSWEDIYEIDNKNMIIDMKHRIGGCYGDSMTIVSLAPHQTRSMYMQLFNHHNYKFKIGMHLFKYPKYRRSIHLEQLIATNKLPKNNFIWSNEVDLLKK